jgi:hypothetical protein
MVSGPLSAPRHGEVLRNGAQMPRKIRGEHVAILKPSLPAMVRAVTRGRRARRIK